jgi:hypothetical protein
MNMRRQTLVFTGVAAALLIAACDKAPSITGPQNGLAAQPAFDAIVSKTNEQDVPWADEETNPCNGDKVTIQGSTHYLFTFVFDDTGGYHLYTRSNSKGTGVGSPSLGTYKASEQFYYSEQNPEGPQFTVSSEEQMVIMAPKSEDNYIRHTSVKVTNNANGLPTATKDTVWTKCVG